MTNINTAASLQKRNVSKLSCLDFIVRCSPGDIFLSFSDFLYEKCILYWLLQMCIRPEIIQMTF